MLRMKNTKRDTKRRMRKLFSFNRWLIPLMETYAYVIYTVLICYHLKVNFSLDNISFFKQWKFWAANFIMAVIAMYFHFQAKGVTDIPLLLVTLFFFATGIVAFVKIGKEKKREMESAVWLHIVNNSLAVLSKLKYCTISSNVNNS